MSNFHRLQFGRGAPVPEQPTTCIRIDIKQLDHFISFIKSPHLVQDLPFGQRRLKLSSGEVIDVQNVIRQMIPQKIVRQYTQYCLETKFKPFSERTMLRIWRSRGDGASNEWKCCRRQGMGEKNDRTLNPIRTRALSPDHPLKAQAIWLPQDKNKVL